MVHSNFSKRAVFYACEAYTDQLRAGQGYGDLKATYSICLLMRNLWDDDQFHHQFRLVDRESGRVLQESIEIHTVELAKYNARMRWGDKCQALRLRHSSPARGSGAWGEGVTHCDCEKQIGLGVDARRA